MSRTVSIWLSLAVVFITEAASAQVAVLELHGDKHAKVRGQVSRALKMVAADVEQTPLPAYKAAAKRKHFKGPKAMTPDAVAKVAPGLGIAVAVTGAVEDDALNVVLVSGAGEEFWSKDFQLKKGMLRPPDAFKLAKQIAKLAGNTPAPKQEAVPVARAPAGGGEDEEQAPRARSTKSAKVASHSAAGAGQDEEQPAPTRSKKAAPVASDDEEDAVPVKAAPDKAVASGITLPVADDVTREAERDRARKQYAAEMDESHTTRIETAEDLDLAAEHEGRASANGLEIITLQLAGTLNWRSYCARPGPMHSCAEFDKLEQRPGGAVMEYVTTVPYAGVTLNLEFFPLASNRSAVRGLGVIGGIDRGFARTQVQQRTGSAETPGDPVISTDTFYSGALTFRLPFALSGGSEQQFAHVGLRGGLQGRSFEVDQEANAPIPGSHRQYATVGVDGSVSLSRYLKLEALGLFFVNPSAGEDEMKAFGTNVSGTGWGLEAGLGGDVIGPLKYVARYRLSAYTDRFEGKGDRWTSGEGGAAQEAYSDVFLGIAGSF